MRKTTIIEHSKFLEISSYKTAITGKAARNHMKMEMLGSIIDTIGEKWARMSKDTKSALEYICFLAIEKGFTYAGSKHVSSRYDIDSSTVRRYLSQLDKAGVISRKWRSSVKHNGRGQAVIFFNVHPYYNKYWKKQFFLDVETQSNTQSENDDNPTNTKGNEGKSDSTTEETYISKDLNIRKQHDNHTSHNYDYSFVSSNIPSEFINAVKPFYNSASDIYKLYDRLTLAISKSSNNQGIEKDTSILHSHLDEYIKVFKESIYRLKLGKIKGSFFGYVYKSWENVARLIGMKSNATNGIYYNWLEGEY